MSLLYPTLLMCVYGFFSSLRPSEPFLTAYLMGPDKNLTETQGLIAMQLLEFFFGLATASEVAYYSYIYSIVETEHYQRVTGYCRSITLFGSAAGSLTGQLMLSVGKVQQRHLVIVTLTSAAAAFVAPWFLPMPMRSLFFHKGCGVAEETLNSSRSIMKRTQDSESEEPLNSQDTSMLAMASEVGNHRTGLVEVFRMLFDDFLQCYRQRTLLAWSLWWALATCGYLQVINYAQPLWEKVRPSQEYEIYNGYVEMLSTLLGAVAALLVSYLPICWAVWGELALCVLSLLMAVCIFVMDTLKNIWLCYGSYIVFRATYMLLITVATYQVAASLNMQRYALVFGVNTFVALLLQSLLTVAVVDSAGLGLDVFTQFLIYGGYFTLVSGVFLLAGLCKLASSRRSKHDALPGSQTESESPPASDPGSCI
ncbi:thiamine transporter 1 isoform X2 [Mastacembelus armatus]|uniref:thiamine transporter 1 isoform X2 n=1 Tax=Mastacembelus armatus TaxID=205130 RepID=UPI000E45A936|nr:thiamine transporter 1-like isoform X2 [Mastacembelus armatus]